MSAANESLSQKNSHNNKCLSLHNYALLNKYKVAKGFDIAASRYDKKAKIQSEIADYGLTRLEKMSAVMAKNLLDIGCGTASSYERLRGIAEHVSGLDISLNMVRQAWVNRLADQSPCFTGINGDAENLPFQKSSIDTVFSSMALQWCQSPKQVLGEVYRVLKPDGKAVLSIMSGESFDNLQKAWQYLGLPSRINTFHSIQTWIEASEGLNWSQDFHETSFTSYHKSVFDMFGSIKSIGANTKINETANNLNHYISKQEVNALSAYLKASHPNTELFPLTYQLIFIEINK